MMNKVHVLIVEDEFIVAEDIRRNLIKLGYAVNETARSGEEAIELVKENAPDIILLDINLGSGMNGIETAMAIRKVINIPIIYVTAHSDSKTFESARKTAPDAYIIKPFNFNNLHSAIELAIYNYERRSASNPKKLIDQAGKKGEKPGHYLFNGSIFIKNGKGFEKVKLKDICYIKADGSYSKLFTDKREFTLAMNLHTVLDRLNSNEFMRVHRSYAIKVSCIERIEVDCVKIGDAVIPISKKLREDLLKRVTSL